MLNIIIIIIIIIIMIIKVGELSLVSYIGASTPVEFIQKTTLLSPARILRKVLKCWRTC